MILGSFMIVPDPECLPKIHFTQTVLNLTIVRPHYPILGHADCDDDDDM